MDAVCLIAAPGAGADDLCRVLAQCPDIEVRHGPERAAAIKADPESWFDAVEARARDTGKRLIVFPLHSDDVTPEAAERTLMARPGMRIVIVMRKQIEAYVAWQTELAGAQRRPAIDVDRFAQWLDRQERWHAHWQGWLKRRYMPCPILRYETDIGQPPERALRRAAAATAQVGVTIRIPAAIVAGGEAQPRQVLAEAVANWAEANPAIFARGLERRAFGYPL